MLGFGLSHNYPLSKDTKLNRIALKGYDATLMSAFEASGMKGQVKAVYHDHHDEGRKWLTEKFIDIPEYDEGPELDEAFSSSKHAIKVLSFTDLSNTQGVVSKGLKWRYPPLLWVTPPSVVTRYERQFIAYGNEAELATIYADLNLVFIIPAKEERNLN